MELWLEVLLKALIGAGVVISITVGFYLAMYFIASGLLTGYRQKRKIDERYQMEKQELEEIILQQAAESEELLAITQKQNALLLELEQTKKQLFEIQEAKDKADDELKKVKRKLRTVEKNAD